MITRRRNAHVQPGIFAPGTAREETQQSILDIVPLDYFLAHPATRPWWAKSEREGLGAGEIVDPAVTLADGMEGVLQRMTLLGKAQSQGANAGTGWRIFIDRIAYLQTSWTFAGSLDTAGRFDYLMEGDGLGQSWGTLNIWLVENAVVEIGMNNNGGTNDAMGWTCYGAYWPTTVRKDYDPAKWWGASKR